MKKVVLTIAMGMLFVGAAEAQEVTVVDGFRPGASVTRLDAVTLAVAAREECALGTTSWQAMSVGPDGVACRSRITGGLTRDYIYRFTAENCVGELWARPQDPQDIAFRADGSLAVLDMFGIRDTEESAVVLLDAAGNETWSDMPPADHHFYGMDVPRAGPLENGLVVISFVGWSSEWYVFRWRPDAVGGLVREGPFGPMDLMPYLDCVSAEGRCALHPRMMPDGLTFLVGEGATNRVKEFDLEGRLVRTFATVEQDAAALASGVPGTRYDRVTNVLPMADGRVLVLSTRRLREYDSAGNLLRMADIIFGAASIVSHAQWQPFESAGITCRPWSTGFWKRQCLGESTARRARGPRGTGRGSDAPPVHPEFRDARLPELMARANPWLAPHGLTACEALRPDDPSSFRDKALRRLAAIALNFADARLGRRCPIEHRGVARTVGDALDEFHVLLASSDASDHREAFHLAGSILGEAD